MKQSLTYDEIKDFFQVCKDEQSLRALLTYYKETKERELYFLKKIKAVHLVVHFVLVGSLFFLSMFL